MGLRIKTLNGVTEVKHPPNGGWGWVLVVTTFFNMGIGYGFPKSMGIYFNDLKDEFGVSNTAISWLVTFVLSILTLSGLIAQVFKRWFDERQIVMAGGVLSCSGMVICSVAPNIFVMYFGGLLLGFGNGIAAIPCVGQLALYFSTWTALATGVSLSGATVFSTIYPYLVQYLLDEYGWRGSVLILGAINLNACVFGSLIHPISCTKDLPESFEIEENRSKNEDNNSRIKQFSLSSFLRKYWLGLCFLLSNMFSSLSMYAPVVYIVPYALEINLHEIQGTTLLSMISVGDFIGRVSSGYLISKLTCLQTRLLNILCTSLWSMTVVQCLAITNTNFFVLLAYSLLYGSSFGVLVTASFTSLARYNDSRHVATAQAMFFAFSGAALLVSGALSGVIVSWIGTFQAAFWFTLFLSGTTASLVSVLTAVVYLYNGGSIVFAKQ